MNLFYFIVSLLGLFIMFKAASLILVAMKDEEEFFREMNKETIILEIIDRYYINNNGKYEIVEFDLEEEIPLITIVSDVPNKTAGSVALDLIEVLTPAIGLFDLETPTRDMWNNRRF